MNSTTSSPTGFFSSPRRQQRLLWASGAVLVVGIGVFLGVFFSRGNSQPTSVQLSTLSNPPTSTTPKPPKTVHPASGAFQVARTFLQTAVQRKNLAAAYGIVGPDLKGGMSLAQWNKGSIPVTLYPSRDAKTAQFVVKTSQPKYLLLQVGLHAQQGSGIKPKALTFTLGLDRVGGKNGQASRWVVDYFIPDYNIPVKANPYNN